MLHRLLSRPLISRRIHSTRFILESNITPSPQNSYLQEVDWLVIHSTLLVMVILTYLLIYSGIILNEINHFLNQNLFVT